MKFCVDVVDNRRTKSDEELRIVRIPLAIVSHAHKASVNKAQSGMDFILELISIERFAAPSCTRPIPGLNKEIGHDSMENHAVIISYKMGWSRLRRRPRHFTNIPSIESAKKLRHALGVS